MTIGLSLTIPLTLFLTLFIPSASQESITFVSLIGAACVLVGFGLMGMQGYEESKEGGNTVPIPRDTDPRIDEGPIEVI